MQDRAATFRVRGRDFVHEPLVANARGVLQKRLGPDVVRDSVLLEQPLDEIRLARVCRDEDRYFFALDACNSASTSSACFDVSTFFQIFLIRPSPPIQ